MLGSQQRVLQCCKAATAGKGQQLIREAAVCCGSGSSDNRSMLPQLVTVVAAVVLTARTQALLMRLHMHSRCSRNLTLRNGDYGVQRRRLCWCWLCVPRNLLLTPCFMQCAQEEIDRKLSA